MAKAEAKTPQENKEEARKRECLNEIQAVLEKYNLALIPVNNPSFQLMAVEEKKDEQKENKQKDDGQDKS